jgi:hypothetical protein
MSNMLHDRNNYLNITFLNRLVVVLILITFLFGCSTTVHNIRSVNELNGNKLLTGRFVFYNNNLPVETSKGFTVYLKKGEDKKLIKFEIDEKGYVYIPVDEGRYSIVRIKYSGLGGLSGYGSFPVLQSSSMNINASDTVVNLGTIKICFQQSAASKAACLAASTYPLGGLFIPSSLKPKLSITHIPDWDVTRQHISSTFNISPVLINDEFVDLSVGTSRAITESNDKLRISKAEHQYSSSDWYTKGLSEFSKGNFSAVISCMSKAIELGQGDTDAYYIYRGYAFGKLNQYEKAIEDYSKSVELAPKNVSAYTSLIEANVIEGNYEDALDNIGKTSFLSLETSEKAIVVYLECITRNLLNKDTIVCEEEFNKILKKRFTVSWDFDDVELWIEAANVDDNTRSYIKEKTKLIKKHKKGWF